MKFDARILIVEDDPVMREELRELLSEKGYNVTSVKSALEGIQMIKREEFDLVLTDLVMPGMDGMQLLNEIKKVRPKVKVIMITAYGTIDSAVKAVKMGAADFIPKPFNLAELEVIINKTLEEARLEGALYARKARKGGITESSAPKRKSQIKSLVNPIRRRMLVYISSAGKARFTDIRKELGLDAPNLSYHLRNLKDAELIAQDRDNLYHLTDLGKKARENIKKFL